jgi:RIO-like serine/threonine protein kinase
MTNLLPRTAHQHAYFDAGILHRDISVGNTLITDEGKGLLIDWDLCLNLIVNNDRASARRPDRTVSTHIFAIHLILTMPLGNVAVYVSRAAS